MFESQEARGVGGLPARGRAPLEHVRIRVPARRPAVQSIRDQSAMSWNTVWEAATQQGAIEPRAHAQLIASKHQ